MKIMLVSALPPPAGGIAVWTERYLEYCKKWAINVELVNIALTGLRGKKINDRTSLVDEFTRTLRVLRDMNRKLDETNPSVVHMNTSCGPFGIFRDLLCVKAAKKRRVPIILHFHCNVENRVHGKAGMWALNKMIGMASKVLVLNSTSKSFVEPYSKTIPLIVPNFINGDFLTDDHIIRKEIREIVFVGHVQITKGCREILEVAAKMPDIHFTLIGPVADEIATIPCPDNVYLAGPKEPNEVKWYLQKADLFLLPSYTEGFSLSLTEAMSTGVPAIATDVGANKDMLEDKGGVIIPVRDADAIVKSIIELMDTNRRQQMSEWEIRKVRTYYLTETVMEQLINIYHSV